MSETPNNSIVRCAIYTRSATDNPASLAAQEERCRAAAANHSWQFDEGLIFSDNGTSGLHGNDRKGLESLLQRTKERPRPFDYVLCDDTSRLARDLSIAIHIVATLVHHGVGVYFVSEKLDSGDPNFRTILMTRAMVADEYSRALSEKVVKSHHTKVLQGYTPGVRCFGYESVRVDASASKNGKSRGLGATLKIVPSEAETVRTVYRLFADGVSVSEIVRLLNDKKVPGPGKSASRDMANSWNPRSIRRILRRGRYRGTMVWNRTERA